MSRLFAALVVSLLLICYAVNQLDAEEDILACSPNNALQKALAICAAARGGCVAVANYVDGAEKRFLTGEMCAAIVNKITGERYDVDDFLGNSIISLLNTASNHALADEEYKTIGLVGKLLVYSYEGYAFSQCVRSAKAKCLMRYNHAARLGRDGADDYEDIRRLVNLYYYDVSRGDAVGAAAKRTKAVSEKFIEQVSRATHSWRLNSATITQCEGMRCTVAVDATATPQRDNLTQQRWLVTIFVEHVDGTWKIDKLSGHDVYRDVEKLIKNYFAALGNARYEVARELWVEEPKNLASIITDKYNYEPFVNILEYSEVRIVIEIQLSITSKSDFLYMERWRGKSVIMNEEGSWKIALMQLKRSS